MLRVAGFVTLSMCVSLASTACDSKKDADPNAGLLPTAASLAPSKADPTAKIVKFTLEKDGKTDIDMPGPDEHIKARTTASAGQLDLDLTNLANSRGEVRSDLTTLVMYHWEEAAKNKAQSEHAQTWLEAVVEGKVNEENRWAVLAIRSIDGLSATDVTKLAAAKEGSEDVRTVTMTLHGDFLVHGHKAEKTANVEVKFHYPSGAAADSKPTSITVKSKDPMRITLADHDIKPRDPVGKLMLKKFDLLGTKVANVADVTVDMKATPAQ
jgi:peptidoglycan hydrolase-like protein with peptidoglycan-binding domain